jgi:hypothetical protein
MHARQMYSDTIVINGYPLPIFKSKCTKCFFVKHTEVVKLLGGRDIFHPQRLYERLTTPMFIREYELYLHKVKSEDARGIEWILMPSYILADVILWQTTRYNERAIELFPRLGHYFRKDMITLYAASRLPEGAFHEKLVFNLNAA